ncbi:hypothetical protein R6258_00855 [Halomonas sp. HP20-15]|uniref:hypothetical protein n=1 Tax=Halomonas sp. HP20-15 TaxID=3085901 RepID=UPI002980ADF0|nr:hypothetical protein [Halomonas sp. HP20-15]MDW5375455.1 hypothetical protein [Halomonas sp. HP20-15]
MGLFDLPGPLFAAIDRAMAMALSPAWRLACWAALAGAGTLMLYKLMSPQQRIGQAKRAAREARQRLNAFDGELSEAGPLIRAQFVAAFRHLGLVIPGTLLSILPLLALLVWLDGHYARSYPVASEAPVVTTSPRHLESRWVKLGDEPPRVQVSRGGELLAEVLVSSPVPIVEHRHWWNWLFANPLGYLPADSGIERIEIAFPEREYLAYGPGWMRSWLTIFFPVMLVVSLLMFRWAKVQ